MQREVSVNSADETDKKMSQAAERAAGGSQEQSRGLLSRLMRKLTGK
jgi:hypothetical protein